MLLFHTRFTNFHQFFLYLDGNASLTLPPETIESIKWWETIWWAWIKDPDGLEWAGLIGCGHFTKVASNEISFNQGLLKDMNRIGLNKCGHVTEIIFLKGYAWFRVFSMKNIFIFLPWWIPSFGSHKKIKKYIVIPCPLYIFLSIFSTSRWKRKLDPFTWNNRIHQVMENHLMGPNQGSRWV